MRYSSKVASILSIVVLGAISYLVLLDRDSAMRSLTLGVDRMGKATHVGYEAYVDARLSDLRRSLNFLAGDERVIYAARSLKQDWVTRGKTVGPAEMYQGRDFFVSLIEQLWAARSTKDQGEVLAVYLRDMSDKATLLYCSNDSRIVGGSPTPSEQQLMENADIPKFAQGFIASPLALGLRIAVPLFYENKESGERELIGTVVVSLPVESVVHKYSQLVEVESAVVFTNAYAEANPIVRAERGRFSASSEGHRRVGSFVVTLSSSGTIDEIIERGDLEKLLEGDRSEILALGDMSYLVTALALRDLGQERQQDVASAGSVVFWQGADKEASSVHQDMMRNLRTAIGLAVVVEIVLFVVLWLALGKLEKKGDESSIDLRRLAKELHDEVKVRQAAQEQLAEVRVQSELAVKAKKDFFDSMGVTIVSMLGELGLSGRRLSGYTRDYVASEGRRITEICTALEAILHGSVRIASLDINSEKQRKEFSPIAVTEGVTNIFAAQLAERSIRLTVNYDIPFPVSLTGDAEKIEQLIHNLLGRATKVSKGGEVTLSLSWISGKNELMIKIQDSAPRLEAEKCSKQFLRLQSARNTLVKALDGVEFELPLAIQLTRHLGGAISYSIEDGSIERGDVGATIIVSVPFSEHGADMLESTSQLESYVLSRSLQDRFVNGRVMLLGVSPETERMLVYWGSKIGATFLIYPSLSGVPPEQHINDVGLVIIDRLIIGEHDGALFERFRSCFPHKLVILISADEEHLAANYIAAGFVSCLYKPVREQEFARLITQHLPADLRANNSSNNGHSKTDFSFKSSYGGGDGPIYSTHQERDPVVQAIFMSFVDSLQPKLGSFSQAMDEHDFTRLTREALALGEASAQLGYPLLKEISRALELAASRSDLEACRKELDELRAAVGRVARVRSVVC